MGIFQPDPPFVQRGPSNHTLPEPHAPIPTAGDQPPRRQVAVALLMAAAVAAWPADLEPRLQAPNNARIRIAPLTLATGQAPPVQGPFTVTELRVLVGSWPGALDAPLVPRVPIAVATLPAPPVVTYVPPSRFPDAIARAWQPADPLPVPKVESVVPTFGADVDQPPRVPPNRALAQLVAAWQPPDPLPVQRPPTVVSGFPSVDQPPVIGRSSLSLIVASWAQPWGAQSAGKTAGWNQPLPSSVPPTRFPAHLYAASQPPDPLPVQRLRSVVPTFPAVSQPPRRPPLLVAQRVAIASWPADLEPRLSLPNASRVPFVPLPRPPFHAYWLVHLNELIGPTPQQPSPL